MLDACERVGFGREESRCACGTKLTPQTETGGGCTGDMCDEQAITNTCDVLPRSPRVLLQPLCRSAWKEWLGQAMLPLAAPKSKARECGTRCIILLFSLKRFAEEIGFYLSAGKLRAARNSKRQPSAAESPARAGTRCGNCYPKRRDAREFAARRFSLQSRGYPERHLP